MTPVSFMGGGGGKREGGINCGVIHDFTDVFPPLLV